MDSLIQDLRYAARQLARNPGFTIVAVLTLALGIGSGTAAFSVVDGILLEPLPYENPDELVWVGRSTSQVSVRNAYLPLQALLDYQRQTRTLTGLAGEANNLGLMNLVQQGPPEALRMSQVTPGYFDVFGIRPELGRLLPDQPLLPDGTKPAMLSHAYWQRKFGGSEDAIGETFQLEGHPVMTVVGVLPSSFRSADFTGNPMVLGNPNPVWTTATFVDPPSRTQGRYFPVGRLREGETIQSALAEMEAITARLAEEYPDTDGGVDGVRLGGIVRPLKEVVVGDYRAMTLTFGGAVAAVLLISVLNLVNLQVSRISRRCREFSIRAALGASRWSLVRQMVVESAILTLSGGALGLGVIYSLRDVVLRNTPALLPRMDAITIDGRVFLFGLSVALISAVIIGVIPVLRASQPDLSDTLKDGTPGIVDSRYQRWLRVTLITAETSLAIVLLLGATLLIQSFNRLSSQELGFDPRDVVTARVALPETYANPAVRNAIFRTILEELRLLDGVESAAAANFLPFEGGIASDNIQTESGDGIPGFIYTVSGRYGSVLRMNPVVGRWITPEEVDRAAPVAVVSESAARSMSFGGNPLGRRVRWLDDTSWLTIVGVVPDVRFNMTGEPFPAVYAPYSTDFSPDAGYQSHGMILAARLSGNETLPLGEFLLRFETDSVVTVNAMDSFIREGPHSAARQRYQTTVLTSFAGVSVALVMLDIHSIVAFSTAQRTREIGLRMALGSTTRGVVAEMMRQSVMAATAGIAVGLCLSTTLTQFLESYLFGIEPGESSAYAIVLLAGVFLILVASWVPARRAAHVDPMVALRYE